MTGDARHGRNAQAVAESAEARDEVGRVAYPGLPTSTFGRAQQLLPRGAGSVLSFGVKGRAPAGRAFVDAFGLHCHLADVGDVRRLVVHPSTTTQSQLTEAEQATAGVPPDLLRLSVGLEAIDDTLADLDAGSRAAKS